MQVTAPTVQIIPAVHLLESIHAICKDFVIRTESWGRQRNTRHLSYHFYLKLTRIQHTFRFARNKNVLQRFNWMQTAALHISPQTRISEVIVNM